MMMRIEYLLIIAGVIGILVGLGGLMLDKPMITECRVSNESAIMEAWKEGYRVGNVQQESIVPGWSWDYTPPE